MSEPSMSDGFVNGKTWDNGRSYIYVEAGMHTFSYAVDFPLGTRIKITMEAILPEPNRKEGDEGDAE